MSVLIDANSKVVVQGITGRDGSFHAKGMRDYGTKVVAGVTPGKGGSNVEGVPVFDSVADSVKATGADVSCIFVPAPFAADAIYEAYEGGVKLIVCITEGVPAIEMVDVYSFLAGRNCRLIGPNCPGLISPSKSKVGIMPGNIHIPGPVGLVSRSGTLTYEVVGQLTSAGIGQSTCVGMGGDPVVGTGFIDMLKLFEGDKDTKAVVLIGEIGGNDEERAARFIASEMTKPVVAFVAGQTAPPGKRMGHAGAIIAGGTGTAAEKVAAFKKAGVPVARIPSEIPKLVREALEGTSRD